ncbi:MAG: hypothetical protein IIU58_05180, partial [Clostridia bacterium]|nr:hypothetical protein [Clostridia bacterium]
GMGVHAYIGKVTNADGDTNGNGQIVATAAAVLVDANGKIVKCELDAADYTVSYTSAGEAVAAGEFLTKYEKGEAYGMKAYAGAAKEWFEQADAFEALTVGKTIDEVKAFLAEGDKGTADVINAGCTIMVADFIYAIEKAVANADASLATAEDTLKIGTATTQTVKNATEEKDGANEVAITIVAAAVGNDGAVNAQATDVVDVSFTFDVKGVSKVDIANVVTKKEAGANYGMTAYGFDMNGDGVVKEWFEQADAFNAACFGKNATEIAALAVETGYGAESLQTAGCTIHVGDMVKAAVKAAQ